MEGSQEHVTPAALRMSKNDLLWPTRLAWAGLISPLGATLTFSNQADH